MQYRFISIRAGVVYPSVCLLAFLGFVIVTFIRASVVRVPLMFIMLIGWAFELIYSRSQRHPVRPGCILDPVARKNDGFRGV